MSGIKVTWRNPEQTILVYEFPVAWTWDEFDQVQQASHATIDQTLHHDPIGVVFIIPKAGGLPSFAIPSTLKALSKRHPRIVTIILVTENGFLRMMWQSIMSVFPHSHDLYQIADSFEDATRRAVTCVANANRLPLNN